MTQEPSLLSDEIYPHLTNIRKSINNNNYVTVEYMNNSIIVISNPTVDNCPKLDISKSFQSHYPTISKQILIMFTEDWKSPEFPKKYPDIYKFYKRS